MRTQLTFLDVARVRPDTYRYTLRPPHDAARAASLKVWDAVVDPETVLSLCGMISQAVEDAAARPEAPGIHYEPFVQRGRGLYSAMLPRLPDPALEELRAALRGLQTPLLITHDDPGMTWELLNDGEGEGFLGLKFDIGRRLLSRHVPGQTVSRKTDWRCLVIADPNAEEAGWGLPGARQEAARLCDWLKARSLSCEFLEGKEATFDAVLERLLAGPYDIIHYAGHVVPDADKNEFALRLHGGRLFPAGSIKNHVQGAPLVFLNSCWSGRSRGLAEPGGMVGLTDAFLGAGAQAVIGSLFPAPDIGARAFAESFYSSVLEGRPVGEAMRLARKAVLGAAGCGPAWACFVLYGDPCLRVEPSEVATALRQINLQVGQFEEPALKVLEAALGYAASDRLIGTAHLFTAMIDGADPLLADGLRQQGVPPPRLRDAFKELFERVRREASITMVAESAQFSAGARDILWDAVTLARTEAPRGVRESDLVRAFVRMQGGSAGEVLRKMGIDLGALAPAQAPVAAAPAASSIGPLSEADCEPDAWRVLVRSAQLAGLARVGFVGTPQLFEALLKEPGGLLAKGLSRYGFTVEAGAEKPGPLPAAPGGKVPCSENLKGMLLLAQANAAAQQRERISARDLLDAFVSQGGGEMGKDLRKRGIIPEVLVCDLFLDTGDLDLVRFGEEAASILEAARECARNKGNDVIDRDHLLYGMLNRSALLRKRLSMAGVETQKVADRLYARMGGGLSCFSRADLKVTQMSPVLLKILWMAGTAAGEGRQVEGTHLLQAWLREGGGAGAELLLDSGVTLTGLVEGPED
jgi:hypothetical protein